MKPSALKITHYLLIAAILHVVWGLVPSASKFVINEIPIELYIAVRWSISGLIFAVFLSFTGTWQKVPWKDTLAVAGLGVLGYGIASIGSLYGLKIGGVTNFALLGALNPVVTSMVAIWVLGEKPTRLFYLALPLCVLGLVLLVLGKYQVSSMTTAALSAFFIIGGYTCEAFVFTFSKRFKTKMSAAQYLAISQIATAMVMWMLQGIHFKQTMQLMELSLQGLSAAIFVSVVACVLCYAVLYWLLNHIDGHRLALFDGFHTLSAVVFGYFFFREPMGPLMWVGGAFVLFGLIAGVMPTRQDSLAVSASSQPE